MIISLIGYRGTGKTSLAPRLAAHFGWPWIDADVELERRAGRSIRAIFADGGEPEFRRLERTLLAELLAGDRLVLATGGGAILNPDTRRELKAAGPVVWLQASPSVIVERVNRDATTAERRPALTNAATQLQEIESVLAFREPLYRETASIVVDTESLPVDELLDEVLLAIRTAATAGRGRTA